MLSRAFLCSVGVAAALVAACSKEQQAPQRPPAPVTVMTVAPQTIPYTQTFVAQTESSQQVDIVARVSGFLDKIAYQEGELVKAGPGAVPARSQAVPGAARRPRRASCSRSRRASPRRAPTSRASSRSPSRMRLSQADLDRAQGEFDAAKAAVFSAQAKRRRSRAQSRLHHDPLSGDGAGQPLAAAPGRVHQRDGGEREAHLRRRSRSDLGQFQHLAEPDRELSGADRDEAGGASAEQRLQRGGSARPRKSFRRPARSTSPIPSFSQDTGSFLVRAVMPNPKRELRPGMFVTANVKGAMRPNAVVVPQLAVQQGANGHLVYVVNQSGIAEVRPVIVGDYYGEKDIVIIDGSERGRPRGRGRGAQGGARPAGEDRPGGRSGCASRQLRTGAGRAEAAAKLRNRRGAAPRCSPTSSSTGRSSRRSSRS